MHLVGFTIEIYIKMHGPINVKNSQTVDIIFFMIFVFTA